MRLKYIKDAKEQMANAKDMVIDVPRDGAVNLNQNVPEGMPIGLEIGAGKGQFIHQISLRHKNTFYFAFEKFDSAIIKALHKCIESPRSNLLLVRADAQNIREFFTPHTVDTIYLNFSDPWPKARHEKRRLTNPHFLTQYQTILKPEGCIILKTDNRHFFEYSLMQMNDVMTFELVSLDLHADQDEDNIVTEFEQKHAPYGPIYKIIAKFKEDKQ